MASELHAVLIADVVASGARGPLRSLLHQRLQRASRVHLRNKWLRLPYAVTAGDEFQALAARLDAVPRLLLDLRVQLRPLSLRIGIGIGTVPGRISPPVNRLDGDAFRLARLAIESLKRPSAQVSGSLTAFRTATEEFDATVNLIYALQDTLLRKITEQQWKTIRARMKSRRIEDAARALGLDTSTVSRNLKRGYYGQLAATSSGAEMLIKRQFSTVHKSVQAKRVA
ncbi:MAG TPA: SatD family protein [Candidatus Acidoferrales bacterium]|nr:SatD family protein [Candidatus Acidoferrales bacterium]